MLSFFKCRLSELTFRILSELTFRIAPQLRFEHFLSLSNLDQSPGGSPVIVSPNAWGSATRGVIEARPFLVHACSLALQWIAKTILAQLHWRRSMFGRLSAELKSFLQTGLKVLQGHEQHAEQVAFDLKP